MSLLVLQHEHVDWIGIGSGNIACRCGRDDPYNILYVAEHLLMHDIVASPEKMLSDVVSYENCKLTVDLCLNVDYVTRAGLPCDTQNRIGCSITHTDHNLCSKACKHGMHRTLEP